MDSDFSIELNLALDDDVETVEVDAAYYRDEYQISQGLLELAEERQEERDERRRQRAYAGQEGGRRIKMHSRNYYKKRTCKRCAYKKNRGNV